MLWYGSENIARTDWSETRCVSIVVPVERYGKYRTLDTPHNIPCQRKEKCVTCLASE